MKNEGQCKIKNEKCKKWSHFVPYNYNIGRVSGTFFYILLFTFYIIRSYA